MGTPLKIKVSKIGLRRVLSWPKLDLEPKFQEPGTFDGFGKREQSFILYCLVIDFEPASISDHHHCFFLYALGI